MKENKALSFVTLFQQPTFVNRIYQNYSVSIVEYEYKFHIQTWDSYSGKREFDNIQEAAQEIYVAMDNRAHYLKLRTSVCVTCNTLRDYSYLATTPESIDRNNTMIQVLNAFENCLRHCDN